MRRKAVREPEVKAEAVYGRAMRISRADKITIKPYADMDPKKTWAVVKFNEDKRVFDTGNIKKVISDVQPDDNELHMKVYRECAIADRIDVTDAKVRRKMRKLFLPSAKDLDAVAEEERIKWLTNGKNIDSGRR